MPGLVPGIHVFASAEKTWMAGTSPAMTMRKRRVNSIASQATYLPAAFFGFPISLRNAASSLRAALAASRSILR